MANSRSPNKPARSLTTVEQYFSALPDKRRQGVMALRDLVLSEFPQARETMDYSMPTYWLGEHRFCALACQKNYFAFYLMPHWDLAHFKVELESYDCGKSCIRLRQIQPYDLVLLRQIIQFAGKKLLD